MIFLKIFILISLYFCFSKAEINSSINNEPLYTDTIHTYVSKNVIYWSDSLDTSISSWLGYEKNNDPCEAPIRITKYSKPIDTFFKNDKYLDETEDIFIRLRMDSDLKSKKTDHFGLKLNAQLPFNKCKEKWKLFIQDISLHDDERIATEEEQNTDIGISYYKKIKHGIDSRYSLGLSGIHPFIRGRYGWDLNFKTWKIEPIQTFKYSNKDYFEEETNIYFDKTFKKNIFRIKLHRKTSSRVQGMDYSFSFQYYFNARKKSGMRISQSFLGNTKYTHYSKTHKHTGIHNYVSSLSWRASIWRKWFYYEIRPAVNFHRENNYSPQYSMRFFIDFYFGKYY